MPNQPKTPTRTIRVSDELWERARVRAAAELVTVTSVILAALEEFVAQD